jgi:hypothetical protein
MNIPFRISRQVFFGQVVFELCFFTNATTIPRHGNGWRFGLAPGDEWYMNIRRYPSLR